METEALKEIPEGFVKTGLVLTFDNDKVDKIEDVIIRFLVRDYYIFYSKVPKFDGTKWTEFHFYCRPQDETSIAYRLGCYAQAVIGFYTDKTFENPIHTVPRGFPDCVRIEAYYNDKHDLVIGDKVFENGEKLEKSK